jgi:hypothetical protein
MAGTVWSMGQGRTERMTRLRKRSQFRQAHGRRDLLFETKPISAPPDEPAGRTCETKPISDGWGGQDLRGQPRQTKPIPGGLASPDLRDLVRQTKPICPGHSI